MLHGHQDRVNCVRWLSGGSESGAALLLSGAADSTVRVWSCTSAKPLVVRISPLSLTNAHLLTSASRNRSFRDTPPQ